MSVFNQSRANIIRLIFGGMFLIIFAQLFNLQIISDQYKRMADANALFQKRVYPTRGIIYDRHNKAILNNTIMYDLMVTPSQVKAMDTGYFCQLLEIDTAELRSRLIDARIKNGPFRPSIFEDLLPPELYAKLEENIWRFPGFNLQERPVRVYPFNAAAHIMGYVGEVDSNILVRSRNYYQLGDYVGRSGLEQYYENQLRGQRGSELWLKDNKNRLVGHYAGRASDTPAVAGRNLHTYMDIGLQQLAEKLLANKVGSIVAIEPKTGGIIAMASSPDYDPNSLTGPNKQKNYGKLVLDVSAPLLNRAIKGQYPSGSTYKPLGALIGLDEGVINEKSSYPCRGVYLACNHPVKCDESAPGHAGSLRLAIAHSCNSFFCNTFRLTVDNPQYHSPRLGLMKWKEYVNKFGLGHRIGVDLPSEDGGNIPDTTAYDKEYRGSWNSCTMVTLGIGQDKLLVTPLQMANSISIVANKGYFYVPHFVESVDGYGSAPEDSIVDKYKLKHEVLTHISDEDYETVISGMQDVAEIGTARIARIPGINICAKTGTAENYRAFEGKRRKLNNNSMFVCFAPREDPKIVIAVVVENAGFGSKWAAPIGSLLVEKYLRDTLSDERVRTANMIANTNLLPGFLVRLQYITDSLRAAYYANLTGDSTNLKRLQDPVVRRQLNDSTKKAGVRVVIPYMHTARPMVSTSTARDTNTLRGIDSVRRNGSLVGPSTTPRIPPGPAGRPRDSSAMLRVRDSAGLTRRRDSSEAPKRPAPAPAETTPVIPKNDSTP